jgi:hypothetical protein
MQTTRIHHVPLTIMAIAMSPSLADRQAVSTGSAASMEWSLSSYQPTRSFVLSAKDVDARELAEPAFPLMALAEALLPASRSLVDWERKDADEFFLSQFS